MSTNDTSGMTVEKILINFFNEAEVDVHSDNFNNGRVITKAHTKAIAAINQLIRNEKLELLDRLVTEQELLGDGYEGFMAVKMSVVEAERTKILNEEG